MFPILFKIGKITVYSYGAMVASGFLIGIYLIIKELKRNPVITQNQAIDLAISSFIAGLIGARLLCVALNINLYAKDPIQILFLNRGGLAFHGGIIAALFFSIWFLKKRNLDIPKTGDLFMPYVAFAHGIGRLGCFLNGCCFGKPAEFILAVRFPNEAITRHPTQIYEAVGLLAIFFILKFFYRRRRLDGQIFLGYFVLYSVFRFFLDFLRADLSKVFLGLTASQLISITIFLPSVIIFLYRRREYLIKSR